MPKSLIITEKPSVALDFVRALGGFTKHNGYYENGKYIVTFAFGHLVELQEPEKYNPSFKKWTRGTLPIIPAQFQYKIIRGKNKQFSVIKKLIHRRDVDYIINAGDPGREGELLQRLIYEKANNRKPVKRFWTNDALSASTIKTTLCHLRPESDFDALYASSLSRQHSDWLIGMSATRAFSIALGDLYSIGRVQTCVLALIVNRHKQIVSFKPQDYWLVTADTDKSIKFFYVECKNFANCNNKISSKQKADEIVSQLTGQTAKVVKITNTNKSVAAPKLFSLTVLQQEANRLFGLSAEQTLGIAQGLYEKHYTSYPRTESQYLDQTAETMQNCTKLLTFLNKYPTDRVNLNAGKRVFNQAKLTDHSAIIPQIPDKDGHLSNTELKIYELICRRFIAAFYPPFRYTQTTIFAAANGLTLKADGKVTTDIGWRELYAFTKKNDFVLPKLSEGDLLKITNAASESKQTEPKPHYNESYLLNAMTNAHQFTTDDKLKKILKENAGIGTPATRAQIIETLIRRKYINRKKKSLIPTDKGIFLIDSLSGSQITKTDYTALWEQRLDDIVNGKETPEHFQKDIIEYLQKLVKFSDTLKSNPNIKHNTRGGKMDTKEIGKCPECGGDVIESTKGYGCSNWKDNDGGCKFVIWKVVAKKKLTERQAKQILNGEKVPVKGMKSKAGKTFGAYLKYDKGQKKVVFDGFLD